MYILSDKCALFIFHEKLFKDLTNLVSRAFFRFFYFDGARMKTSNKNMNSNTAAIKIKKSAVKRKEPWGRG